MCWWPIDVYIESCNIAANQYRCLPLLVRLPCWWQPALKKSDPSSLMLPRRFPKVCTPSVITVVAAVGYHLDGCGTGPGAVMTPSAEVGMGWDACEEGEGWQRWGEQAQVDPWENGDREEPRGQKPQAQPQQFGRSGALSTFLCHFWLVTESKWEKGMYLRVSLSWSSIKILETVDASPPDGYVWLLEALKRQYQPRIGFPCTGRNCGLSTKAPRSCWGSLGMRWNVQCSWLIPTPEQTPWEQTLG